MLLIFAIVFSISSIIISYKLNEDYEPYLFIKLIGIFMLSIITISFNTYIPIPLGFVAAFLIAKLSNYNKKPKVICTLLGLLTTILFTILSFIK